MATKDTTLQSDISKMKTGSDGSFKRADASFRNTIAKGSQFEPEIGGFQSFMWLLLIEMVLSCLPKSLSPLRFLFLSYVLLQVRPMGYTSSYPSQLICLYSLGHKSSHRLETEGLRADHL